MDRRPRNGEPPKAAAPELHAGDRTLIQLREERLVPRIERKALGEITVRTMTDEVPSQVEIEARRDEVDVIHEPVGEVVSHRAPPYEEGDDLIVPVYEERVLVRKELVLRERIRVRRVEVSRSTISEELLKRDRLMVEDPDGTGLVTERYPAD